MEQRWDASWRTDGICTGQLVHVPKLFTLSMDNVRYHEVVLVPEFTWDFERSFFVRQGTPGIYLHSIDNGDYTWCLILFPQGLGWVESYGVRLVK